jgi:hypothetical protein
MDSVKRIIEQKWFLIMLGVILGLVLGLLYAWLLNPVDFIDGDIFQLRSDLKQDYLSMAIDSYSVNNNAELALQRYNALGENNREILDAVSAQPGEVSPEAIQSFRALIEIEEGMEGLGEGEATTADEAAGTGSLTGLLLPICGATIVLGLLLGAALYVRGRMVDRGEDIEEGQLEFEDQLPNSLDQVDFGMESARPEAPAADLGPEPLATFRTIYTLGDDMYDDSFSVESPAGDFLGECGVGIGDVIGVGEPNKIAAFEVWLFDKNDIQTVTKVLMSEYTYNDEETRTRLSAKGDPVLAQPGAVVELSTASLMVEARVVDLNYGEGALPPNSFFDRLTIELRAWPSA